MPIGAEACNAEGYYCKPGWHCCHTAENCESKLYHSADGCFAGPEETSRLDTEFHAWLEKSRQAADQQQPLVNTVHCTNTLLAPGAWAWDTKCVSGGANGANGPNGTSGSNRPSDREWIAKSVDELVNDLNSAAPAEQLPPTGTAVAAVPSSMSGPSPRDDSAASGSPPAGSASPADQANAGSSGPSAPGKHWMGTSDPTDCANANSVERSSAYWGYMCVPDANGLGGDQAANAAAEAAKKANLTPRYQSPISPRDLNRRAMAACQGLPLDDTIRLCLRDTKVALVLANDANVRAACAGVQNRDAQACCADAVYLYGPQASWQRKCVQYAKTGRLPSNLPSWVENLQPLKPGEARQGDLSQPADKTGPDKVCGPGQGLKPLQARDGGFGATSCQPLGTIYIAADKPDGGASAGNAPPDPDKVTQFEQNAQALAEMVAQSVAQREGAQLSDADRARCTDVATAAVYSLIKGGTVVVPADCTAIVGAARAEFAYNYAYNKIWTGDPGTQELMTALAMRTPNPGSPRGAQIGPK
jgi:hypothetical protein